MGDVPAIAERLRAIAPRGRAQAYEAHRFNPRDRRGVAQRKRGEGGDRSMKNELKVIHMIARVKISKKSRKKAVRR